MYSKTKHEYYFINPVNIVGVMGKGLALKFKKQYPQHFKNYKVALEENKLDIGKVFIDKDHKIINFPTKKHWRGKSKIEYIALGLDNLILEAKKHQIENIVLPRIGSGLGGLDFERQVLPLIRSKFEKSKHIKNLVISCPDN